MYIREHANTRCIRMHTHTNNPIYVSMTPRAQPWRHPPIPVTSMPSHISQIYARGVILTIQLLVRRQIHTPVARALLK